MNDDASKYGGWNFNNGDEEEYPGFGFQDANLLIGDELKTRPFFAKNPNYGKLYSSSAVKLSEHEIEALLANDIPALTFAVGHRGIKGTGTNIDIRARYINGSWPRDKNEWRHSDIFNVGYPFLYKFYDSISSVIKGGSPL